MVKSDTELKQEFKDGLFYFLFSIFLVGMVVTSVLLGIHVPIMNDKTKDEKERETSKKTVEWCGSLLAVFSIFVSLLVAWKITNRKQPQ